MKISKKLLNISLKKILILSGLVIFAVSIFKVNSSWYVSEVIDGDTVKIERYGKTETIRMVGVNTPETHHPTKGIECFGPEAYQYTKSKLEHQKIKIKTDKLGQDRDIYDRKLAYVYINGQNYSAILIKNGFSKNETYFNTSFSEEFAKLETEARSNNFGMFGQCSNYFRPGLSPNNL